MAWHEYFQYLISLAVSCPTLMATTCVDGEASQGKSNTPIPLTTLRSANCDEWVTWQKMKMFLWRIKCAKYQTQVFVTPERFVSPHAHERPHACMEDEVFPAGHDVTGVSFATSLAAKEDSVAVVEAWTWTPFYSNCNTWMQTYKRNCKAQENCNYPLLGACK